MLSRRVESRRAALSAAARDPSASAIGTSVESARCTRKSPAVSSCVGSIARSKVRRSVALSSRATAVIRGGFVSRGIASSSATGRLVVMITVELSHASPGSSA